MRTGGRGIDESMAEALDVEMVSIPGGTFLMGSDRHYPEERRSIGSRSMAS